MNRSQQQHQKRVSHSLPTSVHPTHEVANPGLMRNRSRTTEIPVVMNTVPNNCGSGSLSNKPAMRPPTKLPSAAARKPHRPSWSPPSVRARLGHGAEADGRQAKLSDRVEDIDGDQPKRSSHASRPPGSRLRQLPRRRGIRGSRKTRPNPNFAGLDGSLFPSQTQSHAKTGASTMMASGLTDWKKLKGNGIPKTLFEYSDRRRDSNLSPPARILPRTTRQRQRTQ